ncbi:F-box/kelch-repeat protein At3g23880-like [Vicia villosa]|uniref:F-box/kelch-repeat protein At3g23880-like n=1 Tax=Vicia villosa TaxID=3911 RepID=UPI00273B8739|nr:F-box/kelch-repeat protein At3g23880-like [Vicia villosa]
MDISPLVFIPEELVAEILSLLPVKTVSRFKCVNKLWNTLISDPTFIDKHLNKSSQKQHLIEVWRDTRDLIIVPFPLYDLHENPSITIHRNNLRCLNDGDYSVVGTCNGLICLYSKSLYKVSTFGYKESSVEYMEYSIHLWNPSTRNKPENFASIRHIHDMKSFHFAFGYDDSKKSYKVVAYHIEACAESEVKVFISGDNVWRNIQSFPVVPLSWEGYSSETFPKNGVHLSNTFNWLAINDYFFSFYRCTDITHVEQIVIISLDLSTETYKVLLVPQGLVEVPQMQPVISVLMGCLCFSHQEKHEFVLWQMKEYGIRESWTRLFKISYQILPMDFRDESFRMACLYKKGDMVVFVSDCSHDPVIYNLRDKKVEEVIINGGGYWFCHVNVYVESLVTVC